MLTPRSTHRIASVSASDFPCFLSPFSSPLSSWYNDEEESLTPSSTHLNSLADQETGTPFIPPLDQRADKSSIATTQDQDEVSFTSTLLLERPARALQSYPAQEADNEFDEGGGYEADSHMGTREFLKKFAKNDQLQPLLRPMGLERIKRCANLIYSQHNRNLLCPENFSTARESLLYFFESGDPSFQQASLYALIDTLHSDPIKPSSFTGLPELVKRLADHIELNKSTSYSTTNLRLLIQAYALALMTFRIHFFKGNGSLVTSQTRDELWERAEAFRLQFIPSITEETARSAGSLKHAKEVDANISFWINFAIQALQDLRSETTATDERHQRICLALKGVLQVAGMVARVASAAIGGPDVGMEVSSENITSAIECFKKAFYHLRDVKVWFAPVLSFHYLCLIVASRPKYIAELAEMAYLYKSADTPAELFFGIICSIEHLVFHSESAEVTEQCFKILINMLSCSQDVIQVRTVQALNHIRSSPNKSTSMAAECLMILIYETMNPLQSILQAMNLRMNIHSDYEHLSLQELQLVNSCMANYVRRFVVVQSDAGIIDSLVVLLTATCSRDASDGTPPAEDVLRALLRIVKNPLTRSADNSTVLHECVRRANTTLFKPLMKHCQHLLEPDVLNSSGYTALMACIDPPTLEAIAHLATICNPNIRGEHGRTFAHLLMLSSDISAADVSYILTQLNWKIKPDLTIREAIEGKTPFHFYVTPTRDKEVDPSNLEKARVMLSLAKEGKIKIDLHLPDRSNHTCLQAIIETGSLALLEAISDDQLVAASSENTVFMMAAQANKPEVLDYLFKRLPNHQFQPSEIIYIFLKWALGFMDERASPYSLMHVLAKNISNHKGLKEAFSTAIPLQIETTDHGINFSFEGKPLKLEDLKAAAAALKPNATAQKLFGFNELMMNCLPSSEKSHKVNELARNREQVRKANVLGRTALQIAILSHNNTWIDILEAGQANLDHADVRGQTALHYAAACLNVRAYTALINKGAKADITDHSHLIPIVLALGLPESMLPTRIFHKLHNLQEVDPYLHLHQSPDRTSPSLGSSEKFEEILKITIQHMDLAAWRSPTYGWTLAHYAAVYSNESMVYDLAKLIPELFFASHKKEGGRPPLVHALFYGKKRNALALIKGWLSAKSNESIGKFPLLTLKNKCKECGIDNFTDILVRLKAIDLIGQMKKECWQYFELVNSKPDLNTQMQALPTPSNRQARALKQDPAYSLPDKSRINHSLEDTPTPTTFKPDQTAQSVPSMRQVAKAAQGIRQAQLSKDPPAGENFNSIQDLPSSIQLRVISPPTASRKIKIAPDAPSLNSPFTMPKTIESSSIYGLVDVLKYFCDNELDKHILLDSINTSERNSCMLAALEHQVDTLKFILNTARSISPQKVIEVLTRRDRFRMEVLHNLCSVQKIHAAKRIVVSANCSIIEAFRKLNQSLKSCMEVILNSVDDPLSLLLRPDGSGLNTLHYIAFYNLDDLFCFVLNYTKTKYPETVEGRNEAIQKLLLSTNDEKRTPLFLAVENACESIIGVYEKLSQQRYNIGATLTDVRGNTLLHAAASVGDVNVCHSLTQLQVQFKSNDQGRTPAHVAASNRRLEALTFFIGAFPAQNVVDAQDLKGQTPAMLALQQPPLETAQVRDRFRRAEALTLELPVEQKPISMGGGFIRPCTRPMSLESAGVDDKMLSRIGLDAEALLADVQQKVAASNPLGQRQPPTGVSHQLLYPDKLTYDELDRLESILLTLINSGAKLNMADHHGATIFHLLCQNDFGNILSVIVQKAIEQKIDFKMLVLKNGMTLVHTCVFHRQINQLKELHKFNLVKPFINTKTNATSSIAMPNRVLRTSEAVTPLLLALLIGAWEEANWLIENGANTTRTTRPEDRKGPKGDNALHIIAAIKNCPDEAVALFDSISLAHPDLLMQPNAVDKLPFTLVVENSNVNLLALTCCRMSCDDKAKQALQRAAQSAPNGSSAFDRMMRKLITHAPLLPLLGTAQKALSGIKKSYKLPTLQDLDKLADEKLQQAKATQPAPALTPRSERRAAYY